jgi:L-ascorbate metabolism protein UlaG (beta-lactamase superfamily)
VLRKRIKHLRRRVALEPEALHDLTATLVSHVHYDHLDLPSLRSLGVQVPAVVPRGVGRLLRGFADVREVDVGDEVRFGRVSVRAVPAEHVGTRLVLRDAPYLRPMLRDAPSLGFVISGSKRVYFAGDTDLFEGMSALAGGLDVALLPVAGWGSKVGAGHLDPERAAQAVRLLRPRIAVPIHWGTLSLPRVAASNEPPGRFRRLAADLAPDVDVQVLEPGTALTF